VFGTNTSQYLETNAIQATRPRNIQVLWLMWRLGTLLMRGLLLNKCMEDGRDAEFFTQNFLEGVVLQAFKIGVHIGNP